jgi:hypothetical protein
LFQELVKIVLRRAAKRLGVEAGARGSGKEFTETEIASELLKTVPFENTVIDRADFARGGNVFKPPTSAIEVQTTQDLVEEDIREDLTGNQAIARLLERPEEVEPLEPAVRGQVQSAQAGARGVPLWLLKPLATTTYRILKRYWDGRQHGFYPTVMEEVLRELYLASAGRWIWSSMKNAARDMFRPNAGLAGLDLHVGLYVIEKLAALGLPVHMVGHSAGSIAICELLAAAARDKIKLRPHNVVFLAPAATSDLFFNELTSRQERFDRFRMITMQNDYEAKDILVPYVYPRSLLYLVSGIMEEAADAPICGMQKFLSGAAPYDGSNLIAIRDFLQKNDRLVLSKTVDAAAIGFRSSALKHGSFNQDASTRESVQAFLQG